MNALREALRIAMVSSQQTTNRPPAAQANVAAPFAQQQHHHQQQQQFPWGFPATNLESRQAAGFAPVSQPQPPRGTNHGNVRPLFQNGLYGRGQPGSGANTVPIAPAYHHQQHQWSHTAEGSSRLNGQAAGLMPPFQPQHPQPLMPTPSTSVNPPRQIRGRNFRQMEAQAPTPLGFGCNPGNPLASGNGSLSGVHPGSRPLRQSPLANGNLGQMVMQWPSVSSCC